MKKILALFLTLVFMCSLSTVAFANNEAIDNLDQPKEVTANVTGEYKGNDRGIVYSVNVSWGSMAFTYNASGDEEWDPLTHTYKLPTDSAGTGTASSWSCENDANKITITNHSNAPVSYAVAFKPDENNLVVKDSTSSASDITIGGASNDTLNETGALSAGLEGKADLAPTVSATLSLDNYYLTATKAASNIAIGTVTITLNKYTAPETP